MFRIWNCIGCDLSFEKNELKFNRDEIGLCRSCLKILNPANQKIRLCPNDATPMEVKPGYDLLLIDRCPACEGVWMDGYETKVISRINQAMKNRSVGHALLFGWITG